MVIYIDSDYMCNSEYSYGLRKIETDSIGILCPEAIQYYRFVPHGEKLNGTVCANDFVQCLNSEAVNKAWAKFYQEHPIPEAPEGYYYQLNELLKWELQEADEE